MNALEVSGLKKVYFKNKGDSVEALKGISFFVKDGDFFALLGPNGAGKSTTISIIAHLVNKSSGKVIIFGHDIDTEPEASKRYVGIMPQEFNFNIFENVLDIVVSQAGYYGIPRKAAMPRAAILLRQLGLWEKRNEQSKNLSGGMKRKLMIVRALIHDPKLLILDEPTAGVDVKTRREMWSYLKKINDEGKTIILTTHYLEEAEQLCRNIAIIHKAEIVENTSMQQLLNKADTEVIELSLQKPIERDIITDEINVSKIGDSTLLVNVKKGDTITKVFRFLESQGITVKSVRNRSNKLEELFVRLTGR